jgi:hypothetical protein
MSRHSNILERLCNKLHRRYGAQDPLFLQVKTELDTCKAREAHVFRRHDWAVSYQTLVRDRNSDYMRQARL